MKGNVKGSRTLIGSVMIFVTSLLAFYGIDLTPEEQTAIAQFYAHGTVIFAFVMRFITSTPVGDGE